MIRDAMSIFLQYELAQAMSELPTASGEGAGAGGVGAAAGFGLGAGLGVGVLLPALWWRAAPLGVPGAAPVAPAVRFCGHCGAPLVPRARFCGHCGTSARRR